MNTTTGLLIICLVTSMITLAIAIRALILTKYISQSFSKLGFVIREDAKKYFDEATEKMLETNKEFRESYVQIVEEGTKEALHDTAGMMEGSIVTAQQEANKIILRARDDARRINVEARKMAVDEMTRSLDNTADTISWVMEHYVHETFSIEQHQEIIDKLLDEYLSEYASHLR